MYIRCFLTRVVLYILNFFFCLSVFFSPVFEIFLTDFVLVMCIVNVLRDVTKPHQYILSNCTVCSLNGTLTIHYHYRPARCLSVDVLLLANVSITSPSVTPSIKFYSVRSSLTVRVSIQCVSTYTDVAQDDVTTAMTFRKQKPLNLPRMRVSAWTLCESAGMHVSVW